MKEIPPIDASNTIRVIEAFIKTRVSEAGAKGVIIGLSGGGQSGAGRCNSTGSHVSLPYKDASGKYKDIRHTNYF